MKLQERDKVFCLPFFYIFIFHVVSDLARLLLILFFLLDGWQLELLAHAVLHLGPQANVLVLVPRQQANPGLHVVV